MTWKIEIADAATEDLREIFTYIAMELRAPESARNVVRRILAEIATLEKMPNRCRQYPRDPLRTKGVRVLDVGNYCVYYLPKNGLISVGRILYSRRDADSTLADGW